MIITILRSKNFGDKGEGEKVFFSTELKINQKLSDLKINKNLF